MVIISRGSLKYSHNFFIVCPSKNSHVQPSMLSKLRRRSSYPFYLIHFSTILYDIFHVIFPKSHTYTLFRPNVRMLISTRNPCDVHVFCLYQFWLFTFLIFMLPIDISKLAICVISPSKKLLFF